MKPLAWAKWPYFCRRPSRCCSRMSRDKTHGITRTAFTAHSPAAACVRCCTPNAPVPRTQRRRSRHPAAASYVLQRAVQGGANLVEAVFSAAETDGLFVAKQHTLALHHASAGEGGGGHDDRGARLLFQLQTLAANIFKPSCSLMELKTFYLCHLANCNAAHHRCNHCTTSRLSFSSSFDQHPMRKAAARDVWNTGQHRAAKIKCWGKTNARAVWEGGGGQCT